jgi:hypothetical protein
MAGKLESAGPGPAAPKPREFARGLNLFDSTMLVVGAMIGSGIFIVPAEMARYVGSAGWLLVAWGWRACSPSPAHYATGNYRP